VIHEAECRLTLNPSLFGKATRVVDGGELAMSLSVRQLANGCLPTTLIIKGEHIGTVLTIAAALTKTDAEIVATARAVQPEMWAGKPDEEVAQTIRAAALEELRRLSVPQAENGG
jgi:hypothetical protein